MNEQPQQVQILQLQSESEDTVNLKEYWLLLIRRWWLIFLILFFVMALTTLYLSHVPKQYQAKAVIKIPSSGGSGANSTLSAFLSMGQSNSNIATEIEIIKGREIAKKVISKLKLDKNPTNSMLTNDQLIMTIRNRLRVSQKSQTSLIEITTISNSPEEAKNIANAAASEYVSLSSELSQKKWESLLSLLEGKLSEAKDELERSRQTLHQYESKEGITMAFSSLLLSGAADRITSGMSEDFQAATALRSNIMQMEIRLESLRDNLPEANPQIIDLKNQIAQAKQKLNQEESKVIEKYNKQFGLSDLAGKVAFNQQVYTTLVAKQEEIKAQFMMQDKSTEITEEAIEPRIPVSPRKTVILMAGFFMGILFGIGSVFLIEFTSNKIRVPRDLEKASKIPILWKIPKIRAKTSDYSGLLINGNASQKSRIQELYKESYRKLRAEIVSLLSPERLENNVKSDGHGKMIMVASSMQNEGKSIVSANLAIALSETGHKVLLVELDQRHPSQNSIFGIESKGGLVDVLTGKALWNDVANIAKMDNLYLLTPGERDDQHDLSGLLVSDNMNKLVEELKREFDFILFDSTPITLASDSIAIGLQVNGAILIARSGFSQKDGISKAIKLMQDNGVKILGVVLNCAEPDKKYLKYYK